MLYWWPALLGWPAILIALVLSVAGIIRRKPVYPVVGAILVLPMTLYMVLSALPGLFGLAFSLSLAGSGIAIRRQHIRAAWIMLMPYIALSSWLAVVVLTE